MRDQTSELADWLGRLGRDNALPPNAPPSTTGAFAPTKATIKVQVKVGGKDRKVLYWAAKARRVNETVMNAPDSYGRYPNMGITHVRNGTLTMRLRAPRAYRESGKTWPPRPLQHGDQERGWGTKVWAVAAYPGHHGKAYHIECIDHGSSVCSFLTPSQVRRKWQDLVVVNALGHDFDISKKGSGKRVKTFGGLSGRTETTVRGHQEQAVRGLLRARTVQRGQETDHHDGGVGVLQRLLHAGREKRVVNVCRLKKK